MLAAVSMVTSMPDELVTIKPRPKTWEERFDDLDTRVNRRLDELTKDVRDRSHAHANILQAHAAELAQLKHIAAQFGELGVAIYGSPRDGNDTGLRGAVQRLAQDVRDTESARQRDRDREEHENAVILTEIKANQSEIRTLSETRSSTSGGWHAVKEIGGALAILFSGISGLVAVVMLLLRIGKL